MRRTRGIQQRRLIGILLIVVIPILYLLYRYEFPYRVLDAYERLQAGLYAQSQGGSQDFERAQGLERQIADLTFEVSQLQYLREENELLRQMIEYEREQRYGMVMADIIAPDGSLDNALTLSVGEREGVAKGDAVIYGAGQLIGKVIAVTPTRSTVLLLTDPQLHVTATMSGNTKPIGVTEGQFGLSVVIDLIPQSVELGEGDVIVTAGLEDAIPQGLLIGTINRIISNENELFKQATLLPFVDAQSIRSVAVITSIDE